MEKKINANVLSLTDRGYSVVDRYICLVVTVEAITSAKKCMQMMANGRAAKLLLRLLYYNSTKRSVSSRSEVLHIMKDV